MRIDLFEPSKNNLNTSNYTDSLIKDGIDPSKIEAITTTDGPLLIIAGPGSGKTKTLVERIIYLIKVKNVEPENILVATFTEKAAKELITRVSNRLLELKIKVNLNEMYIGTLHSIFLRFLEDNREYTRLKRNYTFLDQFDQAYLVYSNFDKFGEIKDLELVAGESKRPTWDRCNELIKQLNKVSEEYLDVKKLKKSKYTEVKALGNAYEAYIEILHEQNSLDFSSIQVEALELLEKYPVVLSELQEKIKYLMIDEYQDTNTIQEMILLKLAGKHNNICVVGDDDQGLYRFRGATIRNILEFPANFKRNRCKKVKLTTNYRSHPGIIDFYNRWMQEIDWKEGRKQFRFDKKVEPREEKFSKNPSVIKVSSDGAEEDYHREVLSCIRTLEKENILSDHNQIAFLFRSVKNDGVLRLAHYLESKGVNVFSPRSALFFERREIALALGCLIFIFPRLFEWLRWNDKAELEIWQYYHDCKRQFAEEVRENKAENKDLLKWAQ
jgi:DNA helicase II / ATP-dependent DNA helicase PcrA